MAVTYRGRARGRPKRTKKKLQWIGLTDGGTFSNVTTGSIGGTLIADSADDTFNPPILVKRIVGNLAFVPQDALSDLTALGILIQLQETNIAGTSQNTLLPLAADIDLLQQDSIKHWWVGVAQFGTASSGGVDVGWNYPMDLRTNFWVQSRETLRIFIQSGADGDLEVCRNIRVFIAFGSG